MDLKSFGLTTYENDAYMALVRDGISTAHQLAKNSGVPHGKIYPTLAALEAKGFVTTYEGVPKRFMSIPPKVVIEAQLTKREREFKELRAQSERLITTLSKMHTKTEEPLEKVKIIQGYKNYLNLSADLHKSAKKEWFSMSRIPLYQPHLDSYKDCVKRGVDVRILTTITEKNKSHLVHWKKTGAVLRSVEMMDTRFSVVDGTHVIIRMSGEGKYLAIWIQNPGLAHGIREYFLMLWKNGKIL